jgi:hypothetical protein
MVSVKINGKIISEKDFSVNGRALTLLDKAMKAMKKKGNKIVVGVSYEKKVC